MSFQMPSSRYILPSFVERTSYGMKESNPYNKLFEERIIFLGVQIDDASAKLMAEKGMFLTANLVAYYAMKERAAEFGMDGDMLAKNDLVIDGGLRSLEICKRAGVPVAYGSDLLGQLQKYQTMEFELRSRVLPMQEVMQSATTTAARLCRMEGEIGAPVRIAVPTEACHLFATDTGARLA